MLPNSMDTHTLLIYCRGEKCRGEKTVYYLRHYMGHSCIPYCNTYYTQGNSVSLMSFVIEIIIIIIIFEFIKP